MDKIRSVYFGAGPPNDRTDISLDIWLNNGQNICLPLRNRINFLYYSRLTSGKDMNIKPETDGGGVYWRDGPRLSFEKIMRMVEEPDEVSGVPKGRFREAKIQKG